MKLLERLVLKMVGRMDNKPKREIVRRPPVEIVREGDDLEYWQNRAAEAEAELRAIQKVEALGNIHEQQRQRLVWQYLQKIEALNLSIPGGLRSQPLAEEGEDQELVNEAYVIFCARRRGGGRLG